MDVRLRVAIVAAAGIQALFGQKDPKPKPASPPKAAPAPRPNAGKANPNAAAKAPGIENVQRLAGMSPKDREKALAGLPPDRRQAVEKRLQNFQQMSPAERQRATFEVERLQKLPQQKQNQVRRAIHQFTDLPEERQAVITAELDRLTAMPEEERRSRMNSEEFRNRYSPAEQQMMSNIAEVLPRREEQ